MSINKKDFTRAKINKEVTPGEMLKTLRELQELSQKGLSELTGIPQSNISAIESNQRQIGRERALMFAKALKVHPSVILFPDFDLRLVA
jgi:transcriptional regulator with XRE-family HTH domain